MDQALTINLGQILKSIETSRKIVGEWGGQRNVVGTGVRGEGKRQDEEAADQRCPRDQRVLCSVYNQSTL